MTLLPQESVTTLDEFGTRPNLFLADEMEFPLVAVPDGTHLLDVLDFYVGAGFVLREDEVRP